MSGYKKTDFEAFQGGLYRETRGGSEFGRLFPPLEISVHADIELVDGGLLRVGDESRQRLLKTTEGILEDFLRLDGEPDKRLLRFARRWGILGLCEHGLPAIHNPPSYPPV